MKRRLVACGGALALVVAGAGACNQIFGIEPATLIDEASGGADPGATSTTSSGSSAQGGGGQGAGAGATTSTSSDVASTTTGSTATASTTASASSTTGGDPCQSGTPVPAQYVLTSADDDVVFYKAAATGELVEATVYPDGTGRLYVGADIEQERVGLRYTLVGLPPGATICEATLSADFIAGVAPSPEGSVRISVWDTVAFPAFEIGAAHDPATHSAATLLTDPQSAWTFEVAGGKVTSPSFHGVLQAALAAQTAPDPTIGILISPHTFTQNTYVGFGDSTGGAPATLQIAYVPP